MVLMERIRSHGEVHGTKEACVEAELRKEIESCKISKRMKWNHLLKIQSSFMFSAYFGLL